MNINFISCIAPPTIPHTIAKTATAFWMNGSFNERVLQEISGACIETKPRGIKATCVGRDDSAQVQVFSASNKNLNSDQRTRLRYFFVCVCLQTQSTTDQNFTKAHQEDTGHLHAVKHLLCKNLGLKRWEGICSKRGMFRNLYRY